MTDFELAKKYTPVVANVLNKLPPNSKVAWLGQKHPKYNRDTVIYDPVIKQVDREDLHHDFYDIHNENGENCFNWNVHDRWQIFNYDLVVGLRVLYLCEKRSVLLKNLTETVDNNKKIIFDFMSGNPKEENGVLYFEKGPDSKSIIPILTPFYPKNQEYMPKINHHDQTLWLGDFQKFKLDLNNLITFRDTVKGRYYSLCEIVRKK